MAPTPVWIVRILTRSSLEFRQRIGEHFGRPLHVGLDDDRQLLDAALGHLLLQRLECQPAALAVEGLLFGLCLPVGDHLAGLDRIVDDLERIARLGQRREPEHLDRRRGPRLLQFAAEVVEEGSHFAVHRAGDEEVAFADRSVLHEDMRHRTAPSIQLGLEHRSLRHALRVGLEIADVGHEQNHLEQLIEILPLTG